LDTIFAHPFFTHDPKKIPRSLPPCCTHVAPDWQEDHDGYLVPVLAEAEEHQNRPTPSSTKTSNHHSSHTTKQHALSGKEPGNQIVASKNKFEIYSETPSQRTGISKLDRQKSSTSSSRIKSVDREFRQGSEDETGSQNPQQNDSMVENMRKMTIGKDDDSLPTKTGSSESPTVTDDEDARALQCMYTRLKEFGLYLESSQTPVSSKPASPVIIGRAEKWVTRYVDYTSKYGLGFLFNDGR
jgi:hypothetical protein